MGRLPPFQSIKANVLEARYPVPSFRLLRIAGNCDPILTLTFVVFVGCFPPDMIFPPSVAFTVLLSLVTVAFASPTQNGGRKCGNQLTPEDILAKEGKFADALSKIDGSVRLAGDLSNYTIPVYFHVIYSGQNLSQGYVP